MHALDWLIADLPCSDDVVCESNDVVVSAARISISANISRNLMNKRHVDRALHTLRIILLSCG